MEVFKRCPKEGCRTISGFSLPEEIIEIDEEYFCPNCKEENKLSKWKEVVKSQYETQNSMRGRDIFYKKKGLDKNNESRN